MSCNHLYDCLRCRGIVEDAEDQAAAAEKRVARLTKQLKDLTTAAKGLDRFLCRMQTEAMTYLQDTRTIGNDFTFLNTILERLDGEGQRAVQGELKRVLLEIEVPGPGEETDA